MGMFKNKKFVRRTAIVFAGTLTLTSVIYGATLTKKIEVTYNNIKLYYNNSQKIMAQEPFSYNGSIYLPVRAVGELVDKNIEWNGSTNSVYVSDKGAAIPDTSIKQLQSEVASKNFEIAKLNAEKSILEAKVKELEANVKDTNTKGNTTATLKYLEEKFDYEYSIDWAFKLSESSSRINVEVSFDSRYDDKKWERLTKSQKESLFRDISRNIRVDFKDMPIYGKVIDSRTDKTIGTFDYSKGNSFYYSDDSSTTFTDLEKDLIKYAKTIDGTDIPIDDIAITGNEDDITFTIYVDLYNRTLQNEWTYALEDNPREIRQLMEYIQEEIKRDYKYASVQGFIEDLYNGSTLAKFDGKRLY